METYCCFEHRLWIIDLWDLKAAFQVLWIYCQNIDEKVGHRHSKTRRPRIFLGFPGLSQLTLWLMVKKTSFSKFHQLSNAHYYSRANAKCYEMKICLFLNISDSDNFWLIILYSSINSFPTSFDIAPSIRRIICSFEIPICLAISRA